MLRRKPRKKQKLKPLRIRRKEAKRSKICHKLVTLGIIIFIIQPIIRYRVALYIINIS
jgi:hypothetical protein